MRTKMIDVAARIGDKVVVLALALLVLLPALHSVSNTDHRSTAVLPPLTPVATTTTQEDATAEGADVLPLSWHDAPPALWNALIEQVPGGYHDDVPGIGTFYVPVGTAVDVPGGLALATLDGWFGCQDFETFDGECSATGPVESMNVPVRTATEVYEHRTNGTTAECGTDAQCAALDADRATAGVDQAGRTVWAQDQAVTVVNVAHAADQTDCRSGQWRPGKILAEDGSWVCTSFYGRATGPSQAVCDYLDKKRVPDARYGHRCV